MLTGTPRQWEVGGWASSAVIVGLVVLSGCGSPRQSQPPASPPVSLAPAVSSTPDPNASAADSALAAYASMWKAYIDAGRTTDPQDDEIVARYADGDALKALRAGLEGSRRDGLVFKGAVTTNPKVAKQTLEAVDVLDCLDTTASTRVKATPGGTPFTDTPGGRRQVTATVKNVGGTWKVISFVPYEVGTC
ncbi:hypothetical protein [Virgisporangium aurantiacum]|uniref:Uncharacterized protein n=1 Tax=Virgisporangium aurantiacum TaxID=175570 RepID=A0A8J4E5K7_9ACTN|nr:hypothetical protein [Virgisporangium aurantiacum]GIJ62411.1 hypothetical protein Vau01_099270 [Virgisporangium aurantiacum]